MLSWKQRQSFFSYLLVVILFSTFAGGCSVKLVADYDANTFEDIIKVSKKVDHFYGSLLETTEAERKYQPYSSQYVEIETDIRALVTRNQARPLNEESTKISEIILKLWVKDKEKHSEKNAYGTITATFDRHRFVRLFNAAASAEKAKKLSPDDLDDTKGSK